MVEEEEEDGTGKAFKDNGVHEAAGIWRNIAVEDRG
jgi:hypothetical protein